MTTGRDRRHSRRRRGALGALGRRWVPLLAVVVVALAAFGIHRLHGAFGSGGDVTATPGGGTDEIVPFSPKRVVMEVFGPPGTAATITYLDLDAQPRRADAAALPWTFDETTTLPAVFVNVQAKSSAGQIGCRITIDGTVTEERVVTEPAAFTYCLEKSG